METIVEVLRMTTKITRERTVDGAPCAILPEMPMDLTVQSCAEVLSRKGFVPFFTIHDDGFFQIWVHPTEWIFMGLSLAGAFIVSAETQQDFQVELDGLAITYGECPEEVEIAYLCDNCNDLHMEVITNPQRPVALPKPLMN